VPRTALHVGRFVLGGAFAMGCGGDPGRDVADDAQPTRGKVAKTSQRTQANVTIDAPLNGSRMTVRSIVVTGTVPAIPTGGDATSR
jgi:hypothetical protein